MVALREDAEFADALMDLPDVVSLVRIIVLYHFSLFELLLKSICSMLEFVAFSY